MLYHHPSLEDIMTPDIIRVDSAPPTLTPRQDRIEAKIVRLLRERASRSALRDAIEAFADYQRHQGIRREQAIVRLEALASRAMSSIAACVPRGVGDSADDRMSMVVRWCAARYSRAD
jgi:hypothetical protein